MKKRIIINPVFEPGDKPGQTIEFEMELPEDRIDIEKAIVSRLRYSVIGGLENVVNIILGEL